MSKKTDLAVVTKRNAELKWNRVGHIARQEPTKFIKCVIIRCPRDTIRSLGRPQMRWLDDIRKIAGSRWYNIAPDRIAWNPLRVTYIQEWTG